MSNDPQHDVSDLSLDLEDATVNDLSIDDTERSEEESDDEVGANLDLSPSKDEEGDKAKRREEAASQHAKSWAGKIVSGKATYADIPENHQYLVPKVKALLGQKEEVKNENGMSAKEVVQFELKKERLKSLQLEPEQVKLLNTKFKYYVDKMKMEPNEALEEAIEFARVDLNGYRAELPKIRIGGNPAPSKTKFEGNEDPTKMSRKELAEFIAHNASVGR